MTFGSLFAGIGGLDLGLERAGMRCAWQVEIDAYARQVLERHWPTVPRYRDVRYFLGSKRWRKSREAWGVDLIAGGFPCQDISNAGKRAGIAGARSGLWSEFARIVRLLRPRYVLVENVDALAVRGLGRVLGDLAALGFDAEWDRIPAAAVGAPHLRWRIFILAYAKESRNGIVSTGRGPEREGAANPNRHRQRVVAYAECARLEIGESERRHVSEKQPPLERSGCTDVSDAASRWAGQRGGQQFAAYCERTRSLYWPQTEPPVCGVADGIPHRVDRLRALGNAVVPQIAEWIGRRIVAWESDRERS